MWHHFISFYYRQYKREREEGGKKPQTENVFFIFFNEIKSHKDFSVLILDIYGCSELSKIPYTLSGSIMNTESSFCKK